MARTTKQIVDAYLVACAALGERAAQEQLVERYHHRFLRHACRLLGNVEQAKDVVQEGWIDILRGLPKLNDENAFAAWSFRIITRKCFGHISTRRKRAQTLRTMECEPAPANNAEAEFELAAERRSLQAALAELSPEHQAAIALFYLEEMSVAETAVALDIPVGTVKSRLLNARKKLRAVLEGEHHEQVGQVDQRNTR